MLNWDDLRVLLAAANACSLAGAARSLNVTHSTIKRRLDALEQALDVRLFVRNREGLTLTEAGRQILDRAKAVEKLVAGIERAADVADDPVSGTVRLTTSESFCGFLVRRLARLRALHPDLTVEVITTNARLDLLRREADFAVRFSRTDELDLLQRSVGSVGWALYGAKSYLDACGRPDDVDDLSAHDVVGYDKSMAGSPGAQWLDKHAADARTVLRGDGIMAVLTATAAGMGLGALPCFLGEMEPTLVRLSEDTLGGGNMAIVVHPDVAKIARVRTVIDYLVEELKKDEPLLSGRQIGPTPTERAP